MGGRPSRSTPIFEGFIMKNVPIIDSVASLAQISEPNRFEIAPGLILEDKLRIKTQRRLEKKFGLPIARIFPGGDPVTKTTWEGVDFNFLDNVIPLIHCMALQVNESVKEIEIEEILENGDQAKILVKIQELFESMASRVKASPKNP